MWNLCDNLTSARGGLLQERSLHLLCCCTCPEVLASLLLFSACTAALGVPAMILLKDTRQAYVQSYVLLLIVCARWRPGWQAVYTELIAPSLHQQPPFSTVCAPPSLARNSRGVRRLNLAASKCCKFGAHIREGPEMLL